MLLTLACAGMEDWVQIAEIDLRTPTWTAALPHREYDAVVAVMALHYLPEQRLRSLYGEIAGVLRPGGLLLNADRMPENGLPSLTIRLDQHARRRHASSAGDSGLPAWQAWWRDAESDPELGPLFPRRSQLFGDHSSAEWTPPITWHVEALRAAGYAEAGQVWRHCTHAAVAAVRTQPHRTEPPL